MSAEGYVGRWPKTYCITDAQCSNPPRSGQLLPPPESDRTFSMLTEAEQTTAEMGPSVTSSQNTDGGSAAGAYPEAGLIVSFTPTSFVLPPSTLALVPFSLAKDPGSRTSLLQSFHVVGSQTGG